MSENNQYPFKVPRTLEIGGQTITIKVVDRCSNCDGEVDGQATYSEGLIEIKYDPSFAADYVQYSQPMSFKCFGA